MAKFELDLFKLQLIYRHLLSRSLILKVLLASAAVAALPFLASVREIDDCGGGGGGTPFPPADLDAIVRDLIKNQWISPGDRSLCIGPPAAAAMRRMGVLAAAAGERCGDGGRIPFLEASFDFVFSAGVERARVLLEMERVLRPDRFGATAVRARGVMRAAAPVAALLRVSDVVAVRAVNGTAPPAVAVVVVFRKRGGVASEE